MKVSDVGPLVTLPASGDCFRITVLTRKETRFPKEQCDEIKKRGIVFTSEDWKKQRKDIQENCQLKKCKQIVGFYDELFLTIDSALQKVP